MSALFFLWQQSTVDARLLSSILLVVFALLLIFAMILGYFLWRRHNSRQRLYERIAELEALGNAGRAIVAGAIRRRKPGIEGLIGADARSPR